MQRMLFFCLLSCLFSANVFAANLCTSLESYKSNQNIDTFLQHEFIQCKNEPLIQMSPLELAVYGYDCPGNYDAAKAILEKQPELAKSVSYSYKHGKNFQYDIPMLALAIYSCCGNETYWAQKKCGPNRQSDIAKLLIENGADVNAYIGSPLMQDENEKNDHTLLDYVRYFPTKGGWCKKDADVSECKKIEQLLLDHGAKTYKELKQAPTPPTVTNTDNQAAPVVSTEPEKTEKSAENTPLTNSSNLQTPVESVDDKSATQEQEQETKTDITTIAESLFTDQQTDTTSTAKEAYEAAKANEQSTANKTLTALTTAATGIGGMELARGLAEQSADKDAAADMAAYLQTMRCSYGEGKSVKAGPDEIELPGGNNQELMKYRAEYIALAADLKERKNALGMKLGIESEEILDKASSGLYDDESIGITSGNYASLYRAQALNSEADQAKIDDAAAASKRRVTGGAIAAGAGVVVGVVGNSLINGKLGKRIKDAKEKKNAEKAEKEALEKLQKCLKDGGAKNTKKLEFEYFTPSVLHIDKISCTGSMWKSKVKNNDATTLFADSTDEATIKETLIENFGCELAGKLLDEELCDTDDNTEVVSTVTTTSTTPTEMTNVTTTEPVTTGTTPTETPTVTTTEPVTTGTTPTGTPTVTTTEPVATGTTPTGTPTVTTTEPVATGATPTETPTVTTTEPVKTGTTTTETKTDNKNQKQRKSTTSQNNNQQQNQQTNKNTQNKTATTTKDSAQKTASRRQWDAKSIAANPGAYCADKYMNASTGNTDEIGRDCCIAIHKDKKATKYDQKTHTCTCNANYKWLHVSKLEGYKCVKKEIKNITTFADVKVSFDQGQKLVTKWANNKNIKLTYVKDSKDVNVVGQDYISYEAKDNTYKFEFDSLNETNKATQAAGIGRAICLIYGGKFESRGMGSTLECSGKIKCDQWKKTVKEMAERAQEPTDKAEAAKCILKVRL